MKTRTVLMLGWWLAALALAEIAGGGTRYVWTNSPSSGSPYESWNTAAHDIQTAVSAAASGETILVTDGVYNVTEHISIGANKTIQSVNGATNTIVVGTESNRCFYLNSGLGGVESVLDGFTITNGHHDSGLEYGNGGGGIYVYRGGIIKNCIIIDNHHVAGTTVSEGGGGVYLCEGGTITNCVIRGNTSVKHGGGVMGWGFGCLREGKVYHSIIESNTAADRGGGLYGYAGHMFSSTSRYNTANNYGGGVYIYCQGGVSNCSIRNNHAYQGGGLYFRNGNETAYTVGIGAHNSDIQENVSEAAGGGVFIEGSDNSTTNNYVRNCLIFANSATNSDGYGGGIRSITRGVIESCTIISNWSSTEGGGVYLDGGSVSNTIIYFNTSPGSSDSNCCSAHTAFGYSLMAPTYSGPSNLGVNPLFGSGWRLSASSPCVNSGSNQDWMTNACDLDGNPRIIASIVDRGCYEYDFVCATCAVYGVNGVIITNGEAPSPGKGTYFMQQRVNTARTNQLSITNTSPTNLVIYGASFSGSGAAHFSADGMPTQVAPGAVSNFNLIFAPSTAGNHLATLDIAANITDSPYRLNLAGGGFTISPASGPDIGGTLVALTNGSLGQLGDITNVLVGGYAAGSIITQDTTWVRFTTPPPPHPTGTVDVVVQSMSMGETTFSNAYTYNPAGALEAVSPTSGARGAQVTITGSNLCNGSDVTNVVICGAAATNIASQSSTQVVVWIGGGTPGPGDVEVYSTSYGMTVSNNAFTYLMAGMLVLGTNDDAVASGDPASAAKGTDLGALAWGLAVTNTLAITNSGNTSLVINVPGIAISGAGAAHFQAADIPAVVAVNSKSNFHLIFCPSAGGTHTAAVSIANSSTSTPYVINLRGIGAPHDQTIAFPPISNQVATSTVSLVATSSSGLAVSYGASGPAEIAGATLSFTGAGAVSVVASQAGNASWNAAPSLTNSFTVSRADQSITFPTISNQVATSSVTLSATAGSGLPVSFAVTNGPAEIAGATLSFTGAGAVSVVASQAGNAIWDAAANITNSLTVSKASQAIAFPAIADQIVTSSVALSATAESGLAVAFAVAGGPGAISAGNVLSFSGTGAVLVAASQAGNALWNAAPTVTNGVTVNPVPPLPAPQNLSASQGTFTDKVALAWSAVSGAGGYQVWRGEGEQGADGRDQRSEIRDQRSAGDSGRSQIGQTAGTTFDDSGAVTGQVYSYWVKATNAYVTGAFSASASGWRAAPAAAMPQAVQADFDGDGKADPTVYVDAVGVWYIKFSASGYSLTALPFGGAGYTAAACDFDGDGKADPAIYQTATGNWQIKLSGSGYSVATMSAFGGSTCQPAAGDYDGDGKADPAIYNTVNGTWSVAMSSAGYAVQGVTGFGGAGRAAVEQNYDSDNRFDAAIYNETNGNWTVLLSAANYITATLWAFGGTGYTPVKGDFDGDGLADPAIYEEASAKWQVKVSGSGYATASLSGFGGSGYLAGAADYDGDWKADLALLNLATGVWRIKLSGSGYAEASLASGWTP